MSSEGQGQGGREPSCPALLFWSLGAQGPLMEGSLNSAAPNPGIRAPLQGPGALSSPHPALPPGTYPEVQVVCPGADDLVLGRAVTQLVLVDVIAPRCVSILIESHRVPRNAWAGGMGVLAQRQGGA